MKGEKKSKNNSFVSGKGGRKTANASAWLYEKAKAPVSGLLINGAESKVYFSDLPTLEGKLQRPFQVTNTLGRFAVSVKVFGGGKKAQLEAATLALAQALVKKNPEFRPLLRKEGLLTRDSRMVESKKWGRHKARRGQQYAKR